jgi:hypothetical protein
MSTWELCEDGKYRNRSGDIRCEHGGRRCRCGLCNGVGVFRKHVGNALTRGYANELTEPRYRWLVSQPCLYCGSPGGGVDRVRNDFGYTVLNSAPACPKCNYAKRSLSAPDFIAHALKIAGFSPTYAQFKTRWIETRTSGPDLEVTT